MVYLKVDCVFKISCFLIYKLPGVLMESIVIDGYVEAHQVSYAEPYDTW